MTKKGVQDFVTKSLAFQDASMMPRPRWKDSCFDVIKIEFPGRDLGGSLHPEIAKLSKLQSLVLRDSNVSGSVDVLANNTELEYLELRNTRVAGQLEDLSKANHLYALDLRGTEVTGDLAALANATYLQGLHLSNRAVLGDLKSLAKMKWLQELDLRGIKVTGDLAALARATELRDLHLSNTAVFGELKSLAKMNDLKELDLGNLKVIGDASVMAEWSKIKHIDLSGTQVEFVKTGFLQQFEPYNRTEHKWTWKCPWPALRFLDVSQTSHFSLAKDLLRPLTGCGELATLKATGCGMTGPLWPEIVDGWGDIIPMNRWPLSQALSVLDLASNNIMKVSKLPGSCRTLVLTGNPDVSFGAGVLQMAIKDMVFVDLRNATFANPSDALLLIGQLAVITHVLRSNCSCCSHFIC